MTPCNEWHPAVRLRLRAALLWLALGLASAAAAPSPVSTQATPGGDAAQAAAPAPAAVAGVEAIGMTVADMERSIAFYRDVLSFQVVSDQEVLGPEHERLRGVFGARLRVVRMRLGGEEIELTEYLAPRGRPIPVGSRSHDLWFQHVAIVVSDMERAYRHLRRHRVEHASTGPQRLPDWNPSAGGIEAFYFRDPDGHHLEILRFPPGKGAARWHRPTDRLFLGIDHTAITVADTDRSLALYRDVLGLRVAGEGENHGGEQERLNNVFGARLRITGLTAGSGPGIELLEYLAPRDGRPYPPDARANDLWHWQIRLATPDLPRVERLARQHRVALVSPGPVELPDERLGYRSGFLIRDPDGHALEVIQR